MECPVCGAFMPAAKTSRRNIKTLAFGQVEVSEQHRWCPGGCRDAYEQLIHHRSTDLSMLVKPGCNIGYDVECYVGRRMYVGNMQAVEIHDELLKRGLEISLSEVYHLADKFLDHLEGVHLDSAAKLGTAIMRAGGYAAHIDATCEKGRGCTFVVLSGWDGWALISGKVETESHESISPLLQQAIDLFGAPAGFMRDMGGAMRKAIENVSCPSDSKPIELVCHYHFGKDIGKDILTCGHERLLSMFNEYKLKKKLRDYVKALSSIMKGRPLRKIVAKWAEGDDAGIPANDEGIAVIRSFAQMILDHNHDESMKKFPFTRPYLELYDRCCSICKKLDAEIVSGRHSGQTKKHIVRLQEILQPIADSGVFKCAADIVREKAAVFDELRSVLRLDSEDGCISKAGEAELDESVLINMENNLCEFADDLKDRLKKSEKRFAASAIEIILEHLEAHWDYLWGHKITMFTSGGEPVSRYMYRTNNVLECFFRPVKRNIRRRAGSGDVGYALEHTKASICYIGNLMSQEYLDIVYDSSLDNLQSKFALYDIAHENEQEYIVNHCITSRDSLSSSDKRVVRNTNYTKKVV